jgi:hypothetical protein
MHGVDVEASRHEEEMRRCQCHSTTREISKKEREENKKMLWPRDNGVEAGNDREHIASIFIFQEFPRPTSVRFSRDEIEYERVMGRRGNTRVHSRALHALPTLRDVL